jgi:hypothetical protein
MTCHDGLVDCQLTPSKGGGVHYLDFGAGWEPLRIATMTMRAIVFAKVS